MGGGDADGSGAIDPGDRALSYQYEGSSGVDGGEEEVQGGTEAALCIEVFY